MKNDGDKEYAEINLSDVGSAIWQRKFYIFFIFVICMSLGVFYLHRADRKYDVTLTLSAAQDSGQSRDLGGLASLTSISGFDIGGGKGGDDFQIFEKLLTSEEVAEKILSHDSIIRKIYAEEWDDETQKWREPERGLTSSIKYFLKNVLAGDLKPDYAQPDAQRLSVLLVGAVSVTKVKSTPFLILSMKTPDPDLGAQILVTMAKETNRFMQTRYQLDGTAAVDFYKSRLDATSTLEHRQILMRLLSSEEQKLMLLSLNDEFVAKIVTGPRQSPNYTSPSLAAVLALCLFAGIFTSGAFVFISEVRRKRTTDAD
jgi:hypothetical protein